MKRRHAKSDQAPKVGEVIVHLDHRDEIEGVRVTLRDSGGMSVFRAGGDAIRAVGRCPRASDGGTLRRGKPARVA